MDKTIKQEWRNAIILYVAMQESTEELYKDFMSDCGDGGSVRSWVTHYKKHNLLEWINEEHCGDCTSVSAPCLRCLIEEVITKVANIFNVPESEIITNG